MTFNVTLPPERYVSLLHGLEVPGYQNAYGGRVALSRYISSNTAYGGAVHALSLWRKLYAMTRGTDDARFVTGTPQTEVFSGQGTRANIIAAMQLVMRHREALARDPEFAAAMAAPNYLQALCDMECFGQDCIGFVGTYLVEAGVDGHFQCRTPRGFLTNNDFRPVTHIDEVRELSVIVTTGANHVQIIDRIHSRSGNHLVLDICQSTSSNAAKGPQVNKRVTLEQHAGNVLQFAEADANMPRRDQPLETAPLYSDYLEWFNSRTGDARRRLPPAPNRAGYASYVRVRATLANQTTGHLGGAVFVLSRNGAPPNPVGGAVYVSTKAGVRLTGRS